MRILTGIQPSGALHLGNYFGAMLPAIQLQQEGEAFYFIANYHSMTSLTDAAQRRQFTLDVALFMLAEAGLSFLGFGVPPGIPTWGNMLSESRTDYLTNPLLAILPGLALTICVLAFNFVGDGLRDAFDPRGSR